MYVFYAAWSLSLLYDFDFLEIHFNVFDDDDELEILDFDDIELTLFDVQINMLFSKFVEYFVNMLLMLLEAVAVDKNVIQVDDAKIVEILSKNLVDKELKNLEDIAKFKEHDYIFEQLIMSDKDDFILIVFANFDLVESDNYVELNVDFREVQTSLRVSNERRNVFVLNDKRIEKTIVHAHSKIFVRFLHYEHRECVIKMITSNKTFAYHVMNVLLDHRDLFSWHLVYLFDERYCVEFEIYSMIVEST